MKTTRLVFLLFISMICINGISQMGVTSYSIYALGINTSQNVRLSGELKLFLNRSVEDVLMEVDGFYNFKPREYHRFSIGLGFNSGPFSESEIYAIIVPAEIEVTPLKDNKRISILFEFAPGLNDDDIDIRWLWGIRYSFGKSKE